MPGFPAFQLPCALWLMFGPGPGMPGTARELPSGDGPAFRARMTAWSAPAPSVVSPIRVQATAQVPATLPRLSSGFGWRVDPIRGVGAMHAGVDIPGPLGTAVHAADNGIVRFAGRAGGYGNMVEIAHPDGLSTRYGHLSRILVGVGTPVARGETIALMGSTGRSTGSHLHFEVRANGRAANPLAYLGPGSASAPAIVSAPSEPHVSAFARARDAAAQGEGPGR